MLYKNDVNTQGASWSVSPPLLGRLAHVALVFTPGKVTAYVDGISLGTKDNPNFGATAGLQGHIGSAGVTPEGALLNPLNGSIDELAIYGDALSENAIAIHNSRFIYGTAVTSPTIESSPTGTLNLLAGGAPVFRVKAAGTAPLSYEWRLNNQAIANNPTATTPTFTILNSTVASSGSYTVTVKNPQGEATSPAFTVNFTAPNPNDKYAALVLADSPTAYWRLSETTGTKLIDYAGGHDGTYELSKVDLGVEGPHGIEPDKAVHFKGTGGTPVAASVPYTPTLNPTGPFSVEFWAKPDQSGSIGRAVLGTQNRNTGRAGYAIYQGFNVNGWEAHLGFAETVLFIQGTTPPAAGRWDHVVLTWDGANSARIYVNSKDEGGATGGPHRNNLAQPLEIGSRFNGSVPYFGTVDEVAFYNYALTPAQVEKHFSIAYFASTIVTPPAPVPDGVEAQTITLSATVTGFPNTYQWYKNGIALDPTSANPDGSLKFSGGVTAANLVISAAVPDDSGAYHLVVTNPLGGSQTAPVNVAVALDKVAPKITYVTASPTLNRVRVGFDKPMTADTLTSLVNYTFTGGLTTAGVTPTTDSRVVDVTTTGMTEGGSYSLAVSGVKDARISQNLIGGNSTRFKAFVRTPGVLAWDYYRGIAGTAVDDLRADPQFPDGVWTHDFLPSFSTMPITIGGNLNNNPAFGALGDNYGGHVYGWITPTEAGNYNFFLRSDDAAQLFISSDSNPANVGPSPIAFETGCCDAFKEPEAEETSALIALEANKSYYIEAFYKEGGGGDYVEVAWRKEGVATTPVPIPGTFLSALAPIPAPRFNQPTLSGGSVAITWTGTGRLQESPDLVTWTDVAGNPGSGHNPPATGDAKFFRLVE